MYRQYADNIIIQRIYVFFQKCFCFFIGTPSYIKQLDEEGLRTYDSSKSNNRSNTPQHTHSDKLKPSLFTHCDMKCIDNMQIT